MHYLLDFDQDIAHTLYMMRNNEREPMNTNATKKEILAKLLATEDITVIQKNVETASFNLESRTLTLPTWKTMDSDTIDHLTGHEVGHALYTPELEWKKAVENKTEGYRSYLNIVEDARIEKLIQRRYPGLRAPFIRSYNNMLDEGFFGKSRQSINAYDLIDRLNVYFKCGASTEVSFSEEEKFWVDELAEIETFDAAEKLATLLYNKAKEEEDAADDDDESCIDDESEDDNQIDGSSEDDEYGESAEDLEDAINKLKDEINEARADGDEEAEMDAKDELEELLHGNEWGEEGGDDWSSDPKAKTDDALKESISEKYADDDDKIRNYYKTDIRPIEKFIRSYKEVLEYTKEFSFADNSSDIGSELLKKFRVNNKPTINYLVKEFEMKKQASEYARTTTSKTGVIDPIKMNSYRYSDDIFKKISVIPEGKNHGLLMYLDFSGSMAENMAATIDQTLNLVMFCRQINIPFRVYSFTTINRSSNGYYNIASVDDGLNSVKMNTEDCLAYSSNLHIMELFNEKMTRMDFIKMSEALLVVGQYWNERYNHHARYVACKVEQIHRDFQLGGTPLNETIMFAMKVFKKFKAENKLDIVNTVFLTDGSSNNIGYYHAEHCTMSARPGSARAKSFLIDRETKKTYDIGTTGYGDTNALLTMYRDNTQSNLIGFRILSNNKIGVRRETANYLPGWEEFEDFWKYMNKNKFSSIPNSGYSEWFGVRGGKALNTANTSIQVADDAKKGAIRNAFKKANSNRKASRVMLSKFIDLVA